MFPDVRFGVINVKLSKIDSNFLFQIFLQLYPHVVRIIFIVVKFQLPRAVTSILNCVIVKIKKKEVRHSELLKRSSRHVEYNTHIRDWCVFFFFLVEHLCELVVDAWNCNVRNNSRQ